MLHTALRLAAFDKHCRPKAYTGCTIRILQWNIRENIVPPSRQVPIYSTVLLLRFQSLLGSDINLNSSETLLLQYLKISMSTLNANLKYKSEICYSYLSVAQPLIFVFCDEQEKSSSFVFIENLFSVSRQFTELSKSTTKPSHRFYSYLLL